MARPKMKEEVKALQAAMEGDMATQLGSVGSTMFNKTLDEVANRLCVTWHVDEGVDLSIGSLTGVQNRSREKMVSKYSRRSDSLLGDLSGLREATRERLQRVLLSKMTAIRSEMRKSPEEREKRMESWGDKGGLYTGLSGGGPPDACDAITREDVRIAYEPRWMIEHGKPIYIQLWLFDARVTDSTPATPYGAYSFRDRPLTFAALTRRAIKAGIIQGDERVGCVDEVSHSVAQWPHDETGLLWLCDEEDVGDLTSGDADERLRLVFVKRIEQKLASERLMGTPASRGGRSTAIRPEHEHHTQNSSGGLRYRLATSVNRDGGGSRSAPQAEPSNNAPTLPSTPHILPKVEPSDDEPTLPVAPQTWLKAEPSNKAPLLTSTTVTAAKIERC